MVQEKVKIEKKEIQAQFMAEVEFGMPSKDCRNFGICQISFIGRNEAFKALNKKVSTAIITIFNQNHVELDFLKSTITPSIYIKNFSGKEFLIQEDFRAGFFKDKRHRIHISIGEYAIFENGGLIKVVFRTFE